VNDRVFTDREIREATIPELRKAQEELGRVVCGFDRMAQIPSDRAKALGPIRDALSSEITRIDSELQRRTYRARHRAPRGTQDIGEWPYMLAAIGTGIGLAPMPYEYYQLLRFAFCVILLWLSYRARWSQWLWTSVPLALLYNPVQPVYLGIKDLWSLVNMGTVYVIYSLVGVTDVLAERKRREVAMAARPPE